MENKMKDLYDYFNESNIKSLYLNGIVVSEYKICSNKENCKTILENSLVVFVLKGSKILKTRNKEYFVKAGNILFMGKGSYVSSQILDTNGDKYEVIMISIDDSMINDIYKINLVSKFPGNMEDDNVQILEMNSFVKSSLLSLTPYFNEDHKFKEMMVKNKIVELLINLMDADQDGKIERFIQLQHKQMNSGFIDILHKTYLEPLTITEFAKRTNLSVSSFKKKFNETFNMPPKKWINRKRLEKAQQMININNYSITEICFLTGFGNLSYFIRSFKKEFGETPKKTQLKQKPAFTKIE
jgi:AraC-like DNA-binding protein